MSVSFRVKVLASHALVALLVGAVTLAIVDRLVARRLEQQVDHRLEAQGRGVASWIRRAQHLGQLAHRLAEVVDARVTILDANGVAVGESDAATGAPPALDVDAPAIEVATARARGVGHATRFSAVRGEPVRYVALAADDDRVVRLGLPIGEVDQVKAELRRQLGAAALVSFLAALGLAALVAGPLTRRLRDATAVARRIGAGDYAVPAPPPSTDELGVLSH
ncbi:MAG TPA: HAMP domain-containing protein, partial [Kofleriaceae bacterium]|nr:HAMP domain-containing protein [Kofleriaceae bacterium]